MGYNRVKNNMKKVALLVLALVTISLGFSSCGKDKACKCTYTYQGETYSDIAFPEDYGVETCKKLADKLDVNNMSSATIKCEKL